MCGGEQKNAPNWLDAPNALNAPNAPNAPNWLDAPSSEPPVLDYEPIRRLAEHSDPKTARLANMLLRLMLHVGGHDEKLAGGELSASDFEAPDDVFDYETARELARDADPSTSLLAKGMLGMMLVMETLEKQWEVINFSESDAVGSDDVDESNKENE